MKDGDEKEEDDKTSELSYEKKLPWMARVEDADHYKEMVAASQARHGLEETGLTAAQGLKAVKSPIAEPCKKCVKTKQLFDKERRDWNMLRQKYIFVPDGWNPDGKMVVVTIPVDDTTYEYYLGIMQCKFKEGTIVYHTVE